MMNQRNRNIDAILVTPTRTSVKTSVVGRSKTGRAFIEFDNAELAKCWRADHQLHQVTFFVRTVIEEEILDI